jgi:hypothetical protein
MAPINSLTPWSHDFLNVLTRNREVNDSCQLTCSLRDMRCVEHGVFL